MEIFKAHRITINQIHILENKPKFLKIKKKFLAYLTFSLLKQEIFIIFAHLLVVLE